MCGGCFTPTISQYIIVVIEYPGAGLCERESEGEGMENMGNSRNKRSPQTPSRLPRFLMMPTNTETNLPICLKSPTGSQEAKARRS
jgi:hypothetical protein